MSDNRDELLVFLARRRWSIFLQWAALVCFATLSVMALASIVCKYGP
jgi:hypothetical protein